MLARALKPIDRLIDGITTYRLLLYYLIFLVVVAIGLSSTHTLHYSPGYIAISASVLVIACWLINKVLAFIFDAPTNPESSLLTALILSLIIPPTPNGTGFLFLLAAAGLAMASKYVLAIRAKHIFNPAAIAVVLTALGPKQYASWWVGTAVMLPYVIIGGLLVMRKMRREHMVIMFLVATTAATALFSVLGKTSVSTNVHNMILTSPIFFLAFVMLIEPYTSPTTHGKQLWYAALVGTVMAPQFHVFNYYSTPEIALVVGNIFAYLVTSKVKLFPVLSEKVKVAKNTAEFVFKSDYALAYQPGQYMEWTLDHNGSDARGARRYFTLASSPTEPTLRIGVKFYDRSSSYKKALLDMDEHTQIVAAQLAGDFVMPKDQNQKLAFLAGGIGITPFRSMVKYLIDSQQSRPVTIIYSANTWADIAYKPLFDEGEKAFGLKTIYTLTAEKLAARLPNVRQGMITAELIKTEIPDYQERLFYISGTHPMVEAMKELLHRELGISRRHIKTDFFPGYA